MDNASNSLTVASTVCGTLRPRPAARRAKSTPSIMSFITPPALKIWSTSDGSQNFVTRATLLAISEDQGVTRSPLGILGSL